MARGKSAPDSLAALRGGLAARRRGAAEVVPRRGEADTAADQMGLLFADLTQADDASHSSQDTQEFHGTQSTQDAADRVEDLVPERGLAGLRSELSSREEQTAGRASVVQPVPRADPAVWSVRALVGRLRERVEGAFREVLVEGEISTCRPASSGHIYLTLKEGETQLSVVMFRRQAQLLPFRPQPGMAVLARGRLSVYEGRGELQLIAETMEPRGTGALLLAMERLKERLSAEGLFNAGRKRPLPAYPRCIGVVTSSAGAVLHDVITVVRRRHARLNLLIYPAAVQGPGCAASVIGGLRWFNAHPELVQLVLLARGGGSPEDLCGFNDEALARAIARSTLPVVSAIGHETDFTIADFVADLRAPTPSAAAEIITASQHRVEERVQAAERGLRRSLRLRMLEARERFGRASAERLLARMQTALDRRGQRVDELARRLDRAMATQQRTREDRLHRLQLALERQQVGTKLRQTRDRLDRLEQWLQYWGPMAAERRRARVESAAGRLGAMSPLAVLERGYALLYAVPEGNGESEEKAMDAKPKLLRSAQEIKVGARIMARLAKGQVEAEVMAITAEKEA